MRIPPSTLSDLNWWRKNITSAHKSIKTFDFQTCIYTDASNTGWGATNGIHEAFGFWDKNQEKLHINAKELLAVKFALKSIADNLKSCEILLRIDNTTTIAYINKMGGVRYPALNKIAKDIWQWAEKRRLFLYASYIPSRENLDADRLSRLKNEDTEWELNNSTFNLISKTFGHPDIDIFATSSNTECKNFISWIPDPKVALIGNWHNF